LAKDCLTCPEEISRIFINELTKNEIQDNEKSKKKQCRIDSSIQTTLNFEKIKLNESRVREIDSILLKTFVCCNIAFNIVENPFFIELLKALCTGYNPPSRRKLATELLEKEVIRINLKIEKVLNNTLNLTLAIDGWTSPTGRSFWNFVILTPTRQEYLYSIQDLSEEKHTGNFLAEEILKVINSIGIKKFAAIITDNGPNIAVARNLITNQFPKIFNVKCIAHCFNLITHDFLNHNFADKTIKYCNIVIKFFKKSHIGNDLINKLITKYQITGGGLKTFVKTRWISVAECTNSILRLKKCLIEVSK
jgi:hypothetical protein